MQASKADMGFTSTRINSKTTTQVYTKPSGTQGSAILKRVVVGLAGSADTTIDIYDNTSAAGTPVFSSLGAVAGFWDLDIECNTGICVVTATGTAGTYFIIWV